MINQSYEEWEKIVASAKVKKYGRLHFSYDRIGILFDYIKVVNKNHQELIHPANKLNIQIEQSPAELLYDYVYLELDTFYELVELYKRDVFQSHFDRIEICV